MRKMGRGGILAGLAFLVLLVTMVSGCDNSVVKRQIGLTEEEEARMAEWRRRNLSGDLPDFMVHFDYDRWNIRADAAPVLKKLAVYLQNNTGAHLQVEGYADERGGPKYNYQLGLKRAAEVKKFLVSAGIAATRLKTVSYGETKPLDLRENESAWARNRRVQFSIIGR